MKKNVLSVSAVGSFIEKVLKNYVADASDTMITDIHLQLNPDSGELLVLNDDELVLAEAFVEEWVGDFGIYAVAERVIREALINLRESGKLDELNLIKPYSFVLIDKDKETVAELLLIDEQDTLFLNDGLLKGLDEELDAFLKELLEK